jgi:hypothetical protein
VRVAEGILAAIGEPIPLGANAQIGVSIGISISGDGWRRTELLFATAMHE